MTVRRARMPFALLWWVETRMRFCLSGIAAFDRRRPAEASCVNARWTDACHHRRNRLHVDSAGPIAPLLDDPKAVLREPAERSRAC